MKLKLASVKDIQILTVTGDVTPHHFQVLRSGITNLFRTGKNKILVEFEDAKALSSAVLRDLSILNLLARELAGNIVLSGIDKATKIRVESLSSPPSISCFEKREEALRSFQQAPPAPRPPVGGALNEVQAAPSINPQARAAIRESENGELGKVRKELEHLRRENRVLIEFVRTSLHGQNIPASNGVYEEKVKVLQGQLNDALNRVKELEA